jgi:Tol biopolymer transport system component
LSGAASKDPSSNQTVTDSSLGTSGANYELTENDEERLDVYRINPEIKQRMHVSTLQKVEEAQEAMTGYSFSPDGSRIAVTYGSKSDRSDNNVPSVAVLFDTATGRMIGRPLHHDDDVFSPCYAPNGKWFVTVSTTAPSAAGTAKPARRSESRFACHTHNDSRKSHQTVNWL